jgi:phospholipid transport system substrate-binding protein
MSNPVSQMQQLTSTLQQDIQKQQFNMEKNPQQLFELIKHDVLPSVDIDHMAGLTLGPKWRESSSQEKKQFVDAFGLTLTRIFANSLSKAADYKVSLFPLRNDKWQTADKVTVHGAVVGGNNSQPSSIAFYLERADNQWKIYDFAVEGVSIVKNYQAQFQSFTDMPSLLNRLNQLNQNN